MKKIYRRLILVSLLALAACSTSYKEKAISVGGFLLSSNSTLTLRPDQPLLCDKNTCGLLVRVDSPYQLANGHLLAGNREILMHAEASGAHATIELSSRGLWGRDLFFTVQNGVGENFDSVSLKTNLDVEVSHIRWVVFDKRYVKM